MKVKLKEAASNKSVEAIISKANNREFPLKKNGWQFNWKDLGKTEGAEFYKLSKINTPGEIEGMLMLTLLYEEMLFMNNIEVAPHNYGSKGKYEHVAGCLLAYGCYKSFELGKNAYVGYLSFTSKTELIELYEKKYGATHAMGQKMFFSPQSGRQLMEKYLNLRFL